MSEDKESILKKYDEFIQYQLDKIDERAAERAIVHAKPADQRQAFEESIDAAIRTHQVAIAALKSVRDIYEGRL